MNKKEALSIIFKSADLYRDNFLAKNILYIYGNVRSPEYMEASFLPGNFHHLTGTVLNNKMSKVDFFQRSVDRRLKEKDFSLKADGTTELKLQVLPLLLEAKTSSRMAGYYNQSKLYLQTDRLVGGVYASMGFIKHEPKSPFFVPNTVDNGDIRKLIIQPKRLLAMYEKHYIEERYSNCIYLAKGISSSKINFPKDFSYLRAMSVEISFPRKCLSETEDKFTSNGIFNTITLPKGCTLNGEDISGCTIHPDEVREDANDPKRVLAVYQKDNDNPLEINLHKEGLLFNRVNVEDLKIAVDIQREKEAELQREKSEEKGNTLDQSKDKGSGEDLE